MDHEKRERIKALHDAKPTFHEKVDAKRKVHEAINLLSSMVVCGEEHSDQSRQAIHEARMAMELL